MPMLLGSKGKDILQWRASAELVAELEKRLVGKWGRSSAKEAEALLRQFIEGLDHELEYENDLQREISALEEGIDEITSPELLPTLLARHREVVSAHFRRRQSVLALCGICNSLHDRAVSKVAALAGERMQQLGQGNPPLHALIVCGDRGRGEQTLESVNRYLLLHEEEKSRSIMFSRQLSTSLKEAGLLAGDHLFWHGTLSNWRALVAGDAGGDEKEGASPLGNGSPLVPELEWRLEAMTDLHQVTGDAGLASAALSSAARTVLEEKNRGHFLQLARRVIALPLALGRFGRWRLEKDGEHRGEMDLQLLGIDPLVMTVRVLAVQAGVVAPGTVARIQSLLEKGFLTVELSERLLKAYQCLMQTRILSEIKTEQPGSWVNSEELDMEQDERLRVSLDTVLNLQKIAYQRMVGMG
ncbi:putative nucleotidyltransferase substrate binding domain-containing protein [Geomonas sp.]|uniref:putative nucleotidyltransferase substrate binding domain-containing protein n=1 Tax=Geomonas sp. TaxID=2651584 RepID=UPI002B461F00|nr:putative nucleotidyltransferase substrate binding domain-containing protein [Geomonas sp.]HJV35171.1 putative nucleotidyltransferase substrate binding domain-containing protein [Geomonas sp.]